jgi:SAM-dependent methyltransferase
MQLAVLPPLPSPTTLLTRSASLARDLAERTCVRDAANGDSCAWFHGLWPDLRILGLVEGPTQWSAFYTRALEPLVTTHRRIMISGAADNAMLAEILAVYGDHAEVTIIDRCPTPLAVNHWLAEQFGTAIASIAHDILTLDADLLAPFDVICGHAILEHFAPGESRARLFQQWRRLLRAGGRIVLVETIDAHNSHAGRRYSPAQGAQMRDDAVARLPRCRPLTSLDPAKLARRIDRFAQRAIAWPLSSRDELASLAAEARLAIEFIGPADGKATPIILTTA